MALTHLNVFSANELGVEYPTDDENSAAGVEYPTDDENEFRIHNNVEPKYSKSALEYIGDVESVHTRFQIFCALHGVGPDSEVLYDADGNIIGIGQDEDGNNVVVRYTTQNETDPTEFYRTFTGRVFDPSGELDMHFPTDCPLTYGPYWPHCYPQDQNVDGANRPIPPWMIELFEQMSDAVSYLGVHVEWCDFIYGRNLRNATSAQRTYDLKNYIVTHVVPTRRRQIAAGMIEHMFRDYGISFDEAASIFAAIDEPQTVYSDTE